MQILFFNIHLGYIISTVIKVYLTMKITTPVATPHIMTVTRTPQIIPKSTELNITYL